MFQYAFGCSVSEQIHAPLSFIDRISNQYRYFLDPFNANVNLEPMSRRHTRPVYTERSLRYDCEVYKYPTSEFIGHWQSEKYFLPDLVRKDLSFKSSFKLKEKAWSHLCNIQKSNSISIHVRRGDYLLHPTVHNVLSLDYYTKAIQIALWNITNPTFFIFTNDVPWVQQNLCPLLRHTHCSIVSHQDVSMHEDMYLMKECKNSIIANSSFSWWGAWLNENTDRLVIAPKQWFAPGSGLDWSDIIPTRWTQI